MSEVIPFPPASAPKRYHVVLVEDIHSGRRFASVVSGPRGPYSAIDTAEAEARTYARREGVAFNWLRVPEEPSK